MNKAAPFYEHAGSWRHVLAICDPAQPGGEATGPFMGNKTTSEYPTFAEAIAARNRFIQEEADRDGNRTCYVAFFEVGPVVLRQPRLPFDGGKGR